MTENTGIAKTWVEITPTIQSVWGETTEIKVVEPDSEPLQFAWVEPNGETSATDLIQVLNIETRKVRGFRPDDDWQNIKNDKAKLAEFFAQLFTD